MNNQKKLLISSSAKKTIRDSVLLAQELDTGIEISRLPMYKTKGLSVTDTINILKSNLEGFNNRVTAHAMFSDINIAGQDYMLREIAQQRCYESFKVGNGIGADTILFHTGYKGTKHYGSIKSFKNNFVAFWKDFIKEFEQAGIIAVIENVFETQPDFNLELFEKIASPNLKLALDAGHVNLYAHDTKVTDWIKAFGENLYHLHIHNNFRENDDHSNLNNGTLDYKEILLTIKESNINPSFVLEMFTEEDIRTSVKFFNEIMN